MAKRKNTAYISSKDSKAISRMNRKITRKLEKERADANKDPKLYETTMKDLHKKLGSPFW